MIKASKDWFLETSVPRNLLFGHTLLKQQIRNYLKERRCYSSFYVLMEYKRSVIKTLIDLYFVAKEEDTPRDAIKYFSQGPKGFKPRESKVILNAIAEFLNEPDILDDKDKFLIKLKMWITSALIDFDEIVYEYVDNKTKCPLARASIAKSYERFKEEIDCKAECSVDKLWKGSRSHLRTLCAQGTEKPHNTNKGFTKPLPLISSAIGDPSAPKTKQNCMKAGDFVIALEMPNHLHMLTFDRAFESICGIIGKEVTVLPSLTALLKERASTS